MSTINEFVEKLRGRLNKELQLADEDKRKADVLQFDRAVGYANGMAIAIGILNQLEEEYKDVPDTNVGKWIPVSEKLPEIFEDTKSSEVVLICGYDKHNDYSWQAIGFHVEAESIKRWFLADCKNTEKPIDWIDIVAWQPLPEPYKGE